jgi:hypothetical protein
LLSTEFPRARRSSRLAGAAGALLLQGGFAFLFLYSMPVFRPPRDLGRELTLFLRPLPKPVPPSAAPTRAGPRSTAPIIIQSIPQSVAPATPDAPPAAIPDIQNFGQALNGCAPETYNNLTPDRRARCPRPGAGVAIQEFPNLMGTRPEAKDEAMWREQWDEAHWMPGLCGPGDGGVVGCLMHQTIAEFERAEDVKWHLARDKAAALQEPKHPLAKAIGVHPQGTEGIAGVEALGSRPAGAIGDK